MRFLLSAVCISAPFVSGSHDTDRVLERGVYVDESFRAASVVRVMDNSDIVLIVRQPDPHYEESEIISRVIMSYQVRFDNVVEVIDNVLTNQSEKGAIIRHIKIEAGLSDADAFVFVKGHDGKCPTLRIGDLLLTKDGCIVYPYTNGTSSTETYTTDASSTSTPEPSTETTTDDVSTLTIDATSGSLDRTTEEPSTSTLELSTSSTDEASTTTMNASTSPINETTTAPEETASTSTVEPTTTTSADDVSSSTMEISPSSSDMTTTAHGEPSSSHIVEILPSTQTSTEAPDTTITHTMTEFGSGTSYESPDIAVPETANQDHVLATSTPADIAIATDAKMQV